MMPGEKFLCRCVAKVAICSSTMDKRPPIFLPNLILEEEILVKLKEGLPVVLQALTATNGMRKTTTAITDTLYFYIVLQYYHFYCRNCARISLS